MITLTKSLKELITDCESIASSSITRAESALILAKANTGHAKNDTLADIMIQMIESQDTDYESTKKSFNKARHILDDARKTITKQLEAALADADALEMIADYLDGSSNAITTQADKSLLAAMFTVERGAPEAKRLAQKYRSAADFTRSEIERLSGGKSWRAKSGEMRVSSGLHSGSWFDRFKRAGEMVLAKHGAEMFEKCASIHGERRAQRLAGSLKSTVSRIKRVNADISKQKRASAARKEW